MSKTWKDSNRNLDDKFAKNSRKNRRKTNTRQNKKRGKFKIYEYDEYSEEYLDRE